MKKAIKALCYLITVFILLSLITVICATFYLSRYKDHSIDSEMIDMLQEQKETEFFCFSSNERRLKCGKPKLIEGADINCGSSYIYTQYCDIPKNLINAFIAIEDKRFYSHNGIDLTRTAHAAINYILKKGSFGGSTITQQLIKNISGHSETTVKRKITEAFASIALEKKYHKDQIIEAYLNIINLAEGCIGIGAAADYYYSTTPSSLTLDQCATIAAITNNPAKYDPEKHPENNKKRRNIILYEMLDQGYITKEDYKNAIASPIKLRLNKKTSEDHINSWYIDMVIKDVINDLSSNLGISKKSASSMVYFGGLRIYTAMDENIQKIVEEYYLNEYNFPIGEGQELPQSSMIVMDPHSGDILAVAGAVGAKKGNRVQNFATDTLRPTGSAIKPISVYAPALDSNIIDWGSIVEDSPVTFKENGDPWPKNANRVYHGKVNVKFAIENSLNTVAVKILERLGNNSSYNFLTQKLGISSLDPKKDMGSASLALGQMSKGISLKELTAAYSIFENGIMSHTRSYYKVTDSKGIVLLDNTAKQERALSRESAAIMTKMLQSVVESGTAKDGITLNEITETAGKSGTTQNNCDRYFIGYTPELLAGVWLGYEYPRSLEALGGNVSVYVWDDVMNKIYNNTQYGSTTRFSLPNTVQKMTINKNNGLPPAQDDDVSLIEEGWFRISEHN